MSRAPMTSTSLDPMRAFSSMLIDNADHATFRGGTALVFPRLICKVILTGPAGNWGRGARV